MGLLSAKRLGGGFIPSHPVRPRRKRRPFGVRLRALPSAQGDRELSVLLRGNTFNVELRLPTKSSRFNSLPQRGSHFKTVDNRFGVASNAARERKERACERRAATIKAEGQEVARRSRDG